MLVEQVHANALVIYRNLVATWFPALKPMLGLACIMPVLFTGRVKPGAEIENGPDFVYEMETLLPNERSHAEIRIVATDEELFGYDPSDIQSITARSLRLRRLISALRPGTEGWANPRAAGGDLWVWRNRPATSLAYRWLWEDLKALHLVKQAPPYGED
jgi:hypothetical protein